MNSTIVQQAKEYMQQCTEKNLAPARELTEIAIKYGKIIAPMYDVNTNKVLIALYLAHCVFSNQRGSEIMKSHTILSADQARIRLSEHHLNQQDIDDICEAIRLHHTIQDSGNIFYEVVKNAEWFKFLTLKGIFVFIHHLWERWLTYHEAQEYALHKLEQKESYLTLDKARELATPSIAFIKKEFINHTK
jgi:hypothetical protein